MFKFAVVVLYASSVSVTALVPVRLAPRQAKSPLFRLMSTVREVPDSPEGWRTILDPNQFAVLRQRATEPPGFSETTAGQLEYKLKKQQGTKYPTEGVFNCVACNSPLYTAQSKFDSGCGWPAFYQGIPGAITEKPDSDGRRIEIVCSHCESHLGHVFKNEGFKTPTNERHCVNGICLNYEAAGEKKEEE